MINSIHNIVLKRIKNYTFLTQVVLNCDLWIDYNLEYRQTIIWIVNELQFGLHRITIIYEHETRDYIE